MFEILPAVREWPQDAEGLAQFLADTAVRSDRAVEAAVSILVRTDVAVWSSAEVGEFVDEWGHVNWRRLYAVGARLWPDPVEATAVRVAVMLGTGVNVVADPPVGELLLALEADPVFASAVVDAVAHAAGVVR